MTNYRYHAIDADGRPTDGETAAESMHAALAALEARGLAVQSIVVANRGVDSAHVAVTPSPRRPPRGPSSQEAAGVLEAYVTRVGQQSRLIAPALRAYAQELPNGQRRRQLEAMAGVLDQQDPAAAARSAADLPDDWTALLSAASSSRDPAHVLREFLAETRYNDELRRQWWATLAYPTVLMLLAAAVLTAIAVLIVPSFREIFDDFDLELPLATRAVVELSNVIVSYGLPLAALGVLGLLAAGALAYSRRDGWIRSRARGLLGRSTSLAQWTRLTGELIEAEVPLPEAVRIARAANRRPGLRRAGWNLAYQLDRGPAVWRAPLRPLTATALYALTAELPAAARARLLKELSASFADKARARLSWTGGMVEPVAILFVGGVVGLMAVAPVLPLVMLVNNLSG